MTTSDFERADALSARRARMLPVLTIIYFSQLATYFSAVDGHRTVDHVKIGAWMVLTVVLLLALTTRGFWFQSKRVRDMVDDEGTRANRMESIRTGFIAANLTAIFIYFSSQFEPITAREAIQLVISIGIGLALLRFGLLERQASKDA